MKFAAANALLSLLLLAVLSTLQANEAIMSIHPFLLFSDATGNDATLVEESAILLPLNLEGDHPTFSMSLSAAEQPQLIEEMFDFSLSPDRFPVFNAGEVEGMGWVEKQGPWERFSYEDSPGSPLDKSIFIGYASFVESLPADYLQPPQSSFFYSTSLQDLRNALLFSLGVVGVELIEPAYGEDWISTADLEDENGLFVSCDCASPNKPRFAIDFQLLERGVYSELRILPYYYTKAGRRVTACRGTGQLQQVLSEMIELMLPGADGKPAMKDGC